MILAEIPRLEILELLSLDLELPSLDLDVQPLGLEPILLLEPSVLPKLDHDIACLDLKLAKLKVYPPLSSLSLFQNSVNALSN
jgi:hypothetical protein